MNNPLDLHQITHVWPRKQSDIEWVEPDERGSWPLSAFTDDSRPIVFDLNLN